MIPTIDYRVAQCEKSLISPKRAGVCVVPKDECRRGTVGVG